VCDTSALDTLSWCSLSQRPIGAADLGFVILILGIHNASMIGDFLIKCPIIVARWCVAFDPFRFCWECRDIRLKGAHVLPSRLTEMAGATKGIDKHLLHCDIGRGRKSFSV
jgi:hypothetical protein